MREFWHIYRNQFVTVTLAQPLCYPVTASITQGEDMSFKLGLPLPNLLVQLSYHMRVPHGSLIRW